MSDRIRTAVDLRRSVEAHEPREFPRADPARGLAEYARRLRLHPEMICRPSPRDVQFQHEKGTT